MVLQTIVRFINYLFASVAIGLILSAVISWIISPIYNGNILRDLLIVCSNFMMFVFCGGTKIKDRWF